jgi:hypothetical protein
LKVVPITVEIYAELAYDSVSGNSGPDFLRRAQAYERRKDFRRQWKVSEQGSLEQGVKGTKDWQGNCNG